MCVCVLPGFWPLQTRYKRPCLMTAFGRGCVHDIWRQGSMHGQNVFEFACLFRGMQRVTPSVVWEGFPVVLSNPDVEIRRSPCRVCIFMLLLLWWCHLLVPLYQVLIRSRSFVCVCVVLLFWNLHAIFIFLFVGNRFSAEFPLDYTGQHP